MLPQTIPVKDLRSSRHKAPLPQLRHLTPEWDRRSPPVAGAASLWCYQRGPLLRRGSAEPL